MGDGHVIALAGPVFRVLVGCSCFPCAGGLYLLCAGDMAPAFAQRARAAHKLQKPSVVLPPPAPSAGPAAPPDVKPYDPQLMRLAEILGALTYLRALCGEPDADAWRTRMQALLDAEGTPAIRGEHLAGAFNRGLEGYGLSYRTCTPNARIVIERFLSEGEQLAKDIGNRYRAS